LNPRSRAAMNDSKNPQRNDSYTHFEKTRREAARSRRRQGILFGVLFLGAFLGSLWIAEVSAERLAGGIPEIFSYIGRTLPPLGWGSLGRDLGEWYWGLGKWLDLLLDTVLIGFLGTLLGVLAAGFSVSRPPAIWHPRYSVYFCMQPDFGDRPFGSGTGLCPHLRLCLRPGPPARGPGHRHPFRRSAGKAVLRGQ
jgi:hypothetical protein